MNQYKKIVRLCAMAAKVVINFKHLKYAIKVLRTELFELSAPTLDHIL